MSTIDNNMNSSEKPELLQLHRYLDGRLDPTQKAAVEEMLRSNAAARRSLDALREEQKLIREALEVRAEPSRRLSDQVLFTLHAEERARFTAARNRKLRRQFVAAASIAAMLLFCLWLVKPRDWAATGQSGTVATLHRDSGITPFKADTRLYEDDLLTTAQGQFVRLSLYNDATLDLDEHSGLKAIKVGANPELRLESGRLGLNAESSRTATTIYVPEGTIRVDAGSRVDIWLPQQSHPRWPEMLDFEPKAVSVALNIAPPTAVLTVFKGTATFMNEKVVAGGTLSAGQRVNFTNSSWIIRNVDLSKSHAQDPRNEHGWHSEKNSEGPPARSTIGLLDTFNFSDLGVRLKLTEQTTPAVVDALKNLQNAMSMTKPEARAEKLALAQSDLRRACEELGQLDDRRRYGRVLEGMAHLERGYMLALSNSSATENETAQNAFKAAEVAFEEAQRPLAAGADAPIPEAQWPKQLNTVGPNATITDLSAENQAALLAAFHHAVAKYWEARVMPPSEAKSVAAAAAQEFSTLRDNIGLHTEWLTVRYAEGLSQRLVGESEKASAAFDDVLSVQLGGCSEVARGTADGIKQAALIALVREHLHSGDQKKALQAAEDFWILYPLDSSSNAGAEIERATKQSPAPENKK